MASLILLTETPDRHVCPLGKATLMVGSDDHSDLHLPSASISKDHASIIFDANEFVLSDNGSTSGSFLNGEPISRSILKHQDLVRFGEYLFMVDLHDEIDEEAFTQKLEEAVAAATASAKAANPKAATANVTVSEGKDGFSKVMNITQPDSRRQTQNLRDKRTSQNIRLLLSEPVAYSPQPKAASARKASAKASSASVKINDTKLGASGMSLLFNLVLLPVSFLLGVYLTLFFMPIEARYPLTEADGFKSLPLSGLLTGLILNKGSEKPEIVTLQPGVIHGTKITTSRDVLIVGKFQLGIKPVSPLNLHLTVKTDTKPVVVLMEKDFEVQPGAEEVTLFSKIVPAGTFNFECVWQVPPAEIFSDNQDSKDEIKRKHQLPGTLFLQSFF